MEKVVKATEEAGNMQKMLAMPLRAENLQLSRLREMGAKSILLPSQLRVMENIFEHVVTGAKLDLSGAPAPFNYAFYLTGPKGAGKTLTVLAAMLEIAAHKRG